MGKRGPLPLPTSVLIGHGSWRAKINRSEPKPSTKRPPRPQWLDRDAKRMWHKLVGFLEACRILTKLDAPLIVQYCQTWSRWKRAEEFLHAHGETYPVKNPAGGTPLMLEWPQVRQALRLAAELTRIEMQLGISPHMRSKLRINARPETPHAHKSEFARRIERGGVDAARRRRQRQLRREQARARR